MQGSTLHKYSNVNPLKGRLGTVQAREVDQEKDSQPAVFAIIRQDALQCFLDPGFCKAGIMRAPGKTLKIAPSL
jgi:hypothetical protein